MYDALGRRVEFGSGSSFTQYFYAAFDPHYNLGNAVAFSGGIRIPVPGGGQATANSGGVYGYRHPNWQGSQMVSSTTTRMVAADSSFSPYGERYSINGYSGFFAGMLMQYPFFTDGYQADARLFEDYAGRWVSPDPAGLGAVDVTNPQTMNRYVYVGDDPLNHVDPSALSDDCNTYYGTYPDGTLWTVTYCSSYGGIQIFNVGQSGPSSRSSNPGPAAGGGSTGVGASAAPNKPTKPCNDANNNRSRFFQQLPGLTSVAKQLNVPTNFIVGLSSFESGWFDNHNVALNNLWGLTQGGGNNIHFSSIQAGNNYFVSKVGPFIQGAQTQAAFFKGLQGEGYNSVNPNYYPTLANRINNIQSWGQACGVSF